MTTGPLIISRFSLKNMSVCASNLSLHPLALTQSFPLHYTIKKFLPPPPPLHPCIFELHISALCFTHLKFQTPIQDFPFCMHIGYMMEIYFSK